MAGQMLDGGKALDQRSTNYKIGMPLECTSHYFSAIRYGYSRV